MPAPAGHEVSGTRRAGQLHLPERLPAPLCSGHASKPGVCLYVHMCMPVCTFIYGFCLYGRGEGGRRMGVSMDGLCTWAW